MNTKITLNQKRFLIIWICFHSFALFINIANVTPSTMISSRVNDQITTNDYYYYFTAGSGHNDGFWPFVNYFNNNDSGLRLITQDKFFGIFNSYDFTEYIFYMILGLGIIYLPKFWSN